MARQVSSKCTDMNPHYSVHAILSRVLARPGTWEAVSLAVSQASAVEHTWMQAFETFFGDHAVAQLLESRGRNRDPMMNQVFEYQRKQGLDGALDVTLQHLYSPVLGAGSMRCASKDWLPLTQQVINKYLDRKFAAGFGRYG